MIFIKKKGSSTVLCGLFSLLACVASSQAGNNLEEEVASLKLQLSLSQSRYGLLCEQYSNLASNCSAPAATCRQCPKGWIHVGDQCLQLNTDRNDYFKSKDKCAETGSHLAILTTKEEHDVVEKEGKRIGGLYTYYWMGLSDLENEGDWRWVDNTRITTPYWDTDQRQPDNNVSGGEHGEDCAVVHSYSQQWSDVPCEFLYPRICQKDAVPL